MLDPTLLINRLAALRVRSKGRGFAVRSYGEALPGKILQLRDRGTRVELHLFTENRGQICTRKDRVRATSIIPALCKKGYHLSAVGCRYSDF